MLPTQIDPGAYKLSWSGEGEIRLAENLALQTYNTTSTTKHLSISRTVRKAENPLRYLQNCEDLMSHVVFAGYEHILAISEKKRDAIMSEIWTLTQLKPGGTLTICCLPGAKHTDYYDPVPADLQTIEPHHIHVKITGSCRFKVGYKAAAVVGRVGYALKWVDSQWCLIIRNFFVNPSSTYCEEPHHSPHCQGHAIHVYNDGGPLGGFGELECNGQTIGGETGLSAMKDSMFLWVFCGDRERISKISSQLLGEELSL
jgi:hypothetical protein